MMKTINYLSNQQTLSTLFDSLCKKGTVSLQSDLLTSDMEFIHDLLTCLDLRYSSTSQEITVGFRNRMESNLLKETSQLLRHLEENKVHRSGGYFGFSNKILKLANCIQDFYHVPLHITEHTIKRHEN